MAKGYKPTEYMYSSARIRALENKLVSREEIFRFIDAYDVDGIIASLDDYGFEMVYTKDGEFLREDTLMSFLYQGLDPTVFANKLFFLTNFCLSYRTKDKLNQFFLYLYQILPYQHISLVQV